MHFSLFNNKQSAARGPKIKRISTEQTHCPIALNATGIFLRFRRGLTKRKHRAGVIESFFSALMFATYFPQERERATVTVVCFFFFFFHALVQILIDKTGNWLRTDIRYVDDIFRSGCIIEMNLFQL